jgi:hypothetical protein
VSNQHTGMKRVKAAAKAVSKAPSDMLYALESALNSIGKSLDDFNVSRTEKLVVDTEHPPPLDALDHLKRLFVCTDKEGSQFMPQRSCERRGFYKFLVSQLTHVEMKFFHQSMYPIVASLRGTAISVLFHHVGIRGGVRQESCHRDWNDPCLGIKRSGLWSQSLIQMCHQTK